MSPKTTVNLSEANPALYRWYERHYGLVKTKDASEPVKIGTSRFHKAAKESEQVEEKVEDASVAELRLEVANSMPIASNETAETAPNVQCEPPVSANTAKDASETREHGTDRSVRVSTTKDHVEGKPKVDDCAEVILEVTGSTLATSEKAVDTASSVQERPPFSAAESRAAFNPVTDGTDRPLKLPKETKPAKEHPIEVSSSARPPSDETSNTASNVQGVTEKPKRQCAKCSGIPEELKQCSKCQFVLYCNVKCQADHWKVHKKECSRLARTRAKKPTPPQPNNDASNSRSSPDISSDPDPSTTISNSILLQEKPLPSANVEEQAKQIDPTERPKKVSRSARSPLHKTSNTAPRVQNQSLYSAILTEAVPGPVTDGTGGSKPATNGDGYVEGRVKETEFTDSATDLAGFAGSPTDETSDTATTVQDKPLPLADVEEALEKNKPVGSLLEAETSARPPSDETSDASSSEQDWSLSPESDINTAAALQESGNLAESPVNVASAAELSNDTTVDVKRVIPVESLPTTDPTFEISPNGEAQVNSTLTLRSFAGMTESSRGGLMIAIREGKIYLNRKTEISAAEFNARVVNETTHFCIGETIMYAHEFNAAFPVGNGRNEGKFMVMGDDLVYGPYSIYDIVDVPGNGLGWVATCAIEKGTFIGGEKPMIVILEEEIRGNIESVIMEKVRALARTELRKFFALKNSFPAYAPPLGIFRSNALQFNDASASGAIFENVSRINHACNPNMQRVRMEDTGEMVLHAVRDIEAGEELTIRYVPSGTYADRQAHLARRCNIQDCLCNLCKLPKAQRDESDGRLQKIKELEECIADEVQLLSKPRTHLDMVLQVNRLLLKERIADDRLALNYYDAFQVTAVHGNIPRAQLFIGMAHLARRTVEGPNSNGTRWTEYYERDVRNWPRFGKTRKWYSEDMKRPDGETLQEYQDWLWGGGLSD